MAYLKDKAFWDWIESHTPKSWENADLYNSVLRPSRHCATVDAAMEAAATRIQAVYVTDLQAQAQEEVGPSRKWPGTVLFQRLWVTSKTHCESSLLSPFTFSSFFSSSSLPLPFPSLSCFLSFPPSSPFFHTKNFNLRRPFSPPSLSLFYLFFLLSSKVNFYGDRCRIRTYEGISQQISSLPPCAGGGGGGENPPTEGPEPLGQTAHKNC